MAVSLQSFHRLDLGPHRTQRLLVRHGDPLQNRLVGAVDRARQLNEIDMRKSALRKVPLYDNPVFTDLDLGSWYEGAGGGRRGFARGCATATAARGGPWPWSRCRTPWRQVGIVAVVIKSLCGGIWRAGGPAAAEGDGDGGRRR